MLSPTLANPVTPAEAATLADDRLLVLSRELAARRRLIDAELATLAGEIARRSAFSLGHDGLAQRLGVRTAEALVQRLVGVSKHDARMLVSAGALIADASSPVGAGLGGGAELAGAELLGSALVAGSLSLDAAHAISAVGGLPTEAVRALITAAPGRTVEQLSIHARAVRDELDEGGIAEREAALRARRYLQLIPQDDGMTRLTGLLDPESAAIVGAAYDAATSPRRGGPRFVDPSAVDRAQELLRDERSTQQVGLDAMVELIRLGADHSGSDTVIGAASAEVRVLVTLDDLDRRASDAATADADVHASGHGRIEGQAAPVSMGTVERRICAFGAIPVLFDGAGNVLDVGRAQRLFTRPQRIALSVRDGGCRFPGCDRPPSWCEAHHIRPWSQGGRTDIGDGILLCRHHHLLLHNNGWRVERDKSDYFVVPPATEDPDRRRILAPAKGAAADLRRRGRIDGVSAGAPAAHVPARGAPLLRSQAMHAPGEAQLVGASAGRLSVQRKESM